MVTRTLSLLGLLLMVGACAAADAEEEAATDTADVTDGKKGAPAERVDAFRALTPITRPSDGILPEGEAERRWARSGGHFTQGLWAGTDDDGRACTIHVIHYDWRDGGTSEWMQVWIDEEAELRRYNEDFDTNVSGVERGIARTESGPHALSLTDDPDPGDDVRAFQSTGDTMKITVHQLVKNAREDYRDVETEVRRFDRPGGGVTVRIKKFLSDDVVRCHDLTPKTSLRVIS